MSETSPITGELSNSKVAAVFPDEASARRAAQAVASALSLAAAQVQVVTPGTGSLPGRKLEPESRGIWRTIVRAHLWFGIAGVVGGLLLFAVLHAMGIRFIVSSPVAAALVIVSSVPWPACGPADWCLCARTTTAWSRPPAMRWTRATPPL